MLRRQHNFRIELNKRGWVIQRPYRAIFVEHLLVLVFVALLINTVVHLMDHLGFLRWLACSVLIFLIGAVASAFSGRRPGEPP